MDYRTESIDGVDYFIADDGEGNIHQIDLRAVGSWGLLLGLTDPAEIVAAILRHQEEPVAPGAPNMWTPMYDALDDGLDAMSQSGVPPELMEDLLDPALGSPVPGAEVLARIEDARSQGRARIDEFPDPLNGDTSAFAGLLTDHADKITEERLKFVDALAPVYELPPPPAFESVPEALDIVNWRTTGIKPSILT